MNWKIRHEGSPKAVENLTLPEVLEGLQDGLWEPTDEVMGPDDPDWVAIENHPQLAEVAADLEPPPRTGHPDETHLDMTPLIDVCLVLLIFFILTTSYAMLQKILDAPELTSDAGKKGPIQVTKEKVDQLMIVVSVTMANGEPVIKVEGQVVDRSQLADALSRYVSEKRKNELLLDYSDDVPHGVVVAIADAARGAHIDKVHNLVREAGTR